MKTSDQIRIPNAPAIPGLVVRHLRRPDDMPGMTRANNAARRGGGIAEAVTVDGMTNQYRHLSGTDPQQDVLVVELDGTIVGYCRVETYDTTNGRRGYEGICLLDPAYRRRGIGGAMLRWQDDRRTEIASAGACDRPQVFGSSNWAADPGGRVLLESRGYRLVRVGNEMIRPDLGAIPSFDPPPGIELRPGRNEDRRPVWDADCEIFRDHWGGNDESEAAWVNFRSAPNQIPALWVIAWAGSEIAGVVRNVVQDPDDQGRRLGYLDSVGVRRPWRRRGLARAMIAESLRTLREAGADSAGLGVDAQNDNHALELYESVGFRVAATEYSFERPFVRPTDSA